MAHEFTTTELTVEDFRRLEEISTMTNACRSAVEQDRGRNKALATFLKLCDEKLSSFLKELKERMKKVP